MRIAVVGPTHPYRGGIAQHTTELARRLDRVGHDVALIGWRHQYPARLYPGQVTASDAERDTAPFEPVRRMLDWYDPGGWLAAGRLVRPSDLVLVAHSNPFQIPAYRTLLGAAGRGARPPARILIAHNVVPHDAPALSRHGIRLLGQVVDGVVVHSASERAAADAWLPGVPSRMVPLPLFGPALAERATAPARAERDEGPVRLLVFGFVRPYKGIPVLLEAAQGLPDLRITIRGECWDADLDRRIRTLSESPGLVGRVTYAPGYVGADEIDHLFSTHDIAALPYLEATGSQNTAVAFSHGVPVVVSDVPALLGGVVDGVNGLVAAAGDVAAWREQLASLTPQRVSRLTSAVRAPDPQLTWDDYVRALVELSQSGASYRTGTAR